MSNKTPSTSVSSQIYDRLIEKDNSTGDLIPSLATEWTFLSPTILSHLSHPTASILNEQTARSQGENIDTLPIGTGAFRLEEWARGNKIILTRFDTYWGEPAKIQNLEFRVIPEKSSRMIALETGEIDIALDISSEVIQANLREIGLDEL